MAGIDAIAVIQNSPDGQAGTIGRKGNGPSALITGRLAIDVGTELAPELCLGACNKEQEQDGPEGCAYAGDVTHAKLVLENEVVYPIRTNQNQM